MNNFVNLRNISVAKKIICNVEKYKGICKEISSKLNWWKDFAKSSDPFEKKWPPDWEAKGTAMDRFDKLIMIRILRQEKLLYSLSFLVSLDL